VVYGRTMGVCHLGDGLVVVEMADLCEPPVGHSLGTMGSIGLAGSSTLALVLVRLRQDRLAADEPGKLAA
jgi:hypothetical protein